MLRSLATLLTCILLSLAIFAQQNASLQIQVTDQNNEIISNAAVKFTQADKLIYEISNNTANIIRLNNLESGKYSLEISAAGFQTKSQEIELKSGENELKIQLELEEIKENVEVAQTAQEQAVNENFGNFLTRDQIAALPDDPEQLKKALRQIAGDENAVIQVDGFTSDTVPDKSQISSIRIVRSSFDAEYHKIGLTYINITTRARNQRFSGSLWFDFNDEALNARNAFAPFRYPEQTKNIFFYLSGPIKKDKAAFFIQVTDTRNFYGKSINAFLPTGQISDSSNSSVDSFGLDSTINYNISKNIASKVQYRFGTSTFRNIGVGDFDLESRGYDIRMTNHLFRFSESGYIGKKILNELRFEFSRENSNTKPKSDETAILVLDSFNSGGAGNRSSFIKTELMAADNLMFGHKNHAMKVGFQAEFENRKIISAINRNGTFIFSSLEDYIANRPSLFTRRIADSEAAVTLFRGGIFFQDDYRVKKNLNLSFGLRYEIQNNLRDFDNVSPRFGFTFAPFKDGKTTFRGGVGFFYDWLIADYLSTISTNDFLQPGDLIIQDPEYPEPTESGSGEVLQKSFWQKDANLKVPQIFHVSFTAEHRFTNKLSFRAKYVYEKGMHQFRSRNLNAPIHGIRSFPEFGNIQNVESSAFFVRNLLNLGLTGSIFKKISYAINYDLAKVINDADSIFSLPSDNYNLKVDRSVSIMDRRHRFSGYASWEIKRGLRIAANYFTNSPRPYNITTGFDDNDDTVFNDRPAGLKRNTARGAWEQQLDFSFSYAFSFFSKNEDNKGKGFSIATTSSEASSGSFDFTDPKKRFSLKFYFNAENILNNVNYKNFVGVRTSPFFGQPINADNARRLNLGVRFNF